MNSTCLVARHRLARPALAVAALALAAGACGSPGDTDRLSTSQQGDDALVITGSTEPSTTTTAEPATTTTTATTTTIATSTSTTSTTTTTDPVSSTESAAVATTALTTTTAPADASTATSNVSTSTSVVTDTTTASDGPATSTSVATSDSVTEPGDGTGDGGVLTSADVASPAQRDSVQVEVRAPVMDIGFSVEGRPIVAERLGTEGGRRVLVIGVIHGNEDAGIQIVDELRARAIDDDIELWLVESMNPDGVARQDRHNSNEVDLNRNFPYNWGPIGEPGNSQYAGPSAASEPETQAMVNFIEQLRPDIAIWYHQDANLIIPSTGRDGRIRARYAELTDLPLAECCGGGGIYTGIAATWARNELKKDSDAVAFIVELPGGTLPTSKVDAHASAVLTIAAEG